MRILTLVSDAHGGRGGIAKFNRDLLNAFSSFPPVKEAAVFPRIIADAMGAIPPKIKYCEKAAGGKWSYIKEILASVRSDADYQLLLCGHINLVPLAVILRMIKVEAPIVLILHGVEAWARPDPFKRRLLEEVDLFVCVSEFTKERFIEGTGLEHKNFEIIPNCVDLTAFRPGPKSPVLTKRYGLEGKKVLLTVGRLDSREKYKGFDEIIGILPELIKEVPNICYLICGDGDDKARLESKASRLGVRDRVIFSGYIAEAEKADHYRAADAFVMPGRGEGFGIVYLEAAACGIPAVGSTADGSRDALLKGRLGILVDPSNPQNIKEGILKALAQPRSVPLELETFSTGRYVERVHALLERFRNGN